MIEFHHTIEVWGIKLDVTGTYEPYIPPTRLDPGWGSFVGIERVSVSGSDVNIYDLLDKKAITRIEEAIDRIEERQ